MDGTLTCQGAYMDLDVCSDANEIRLVAGGTTLLVSCLETLTIYERDVTTGELLSGCPGWLFHCASRPVGSILAGGCAGGERGGSRNGCVAKSSALIAACPRRSPFSPRV
jgi:hypothetical protein